MTQGRPRCFVGTAGWSIPSIHAEAFPADGSHLERYAAVFPAAEINTSFYRPHRRSTYEQWSASTPPSFRFSVKAPKSVTHSDWSDIEPDLDAFFAETAGLGDKLGPILIQLPPKRVFAAIEAGAFLSAFRDRTGGDIVLEPRHASWFGPEADDLLQARRVARVAADPPRASGADRPGGWSGLAYFRLHGSPEIYRSSYAGERLDALASVMRAAADAGSQTWCIFDNTTSYAAAGDALALVRLLGPGCR
ncbi:DUF72 domain-containing protein [Alsobacter sp. KACC 23698]|uniref:DUF72 domain-containing protein n=1 Tax=Alsobacter sp. KACC 23698 TaxID=3149229 RepID=A0AAU7JL54_9HYPH